MNKLLVALSLIAAPLSLVALTPEQQALVDKIDEKHSAFVALREKQSQETEAFVQKYKEKKEKLIFANFFGNSNKQSTSPESTFKELTEELKKIQTEQSTERAQLADRFPIEMFKAGFIAGLTAQQ